MILTTFGIFGSDWLIKEHFARLAVDDFAAVIADQ